jgi:survival of motor neuron-related-splicing factor 30
VGLAHAVACRFELKDMQSVKQANDWKAFMSGKGTKKKAGYMTGKKKESMFAVPDNLTGKVGVIGSGRGMTDAPTKRTRLDF